MAHEDLGSNPIVELNWSELVVAVAGEGGHLYVWCEQQHLQPDSARCLGRYEQEDGSSVNIKYGEIQSSVHWMKTCNWHCK